MQANAHKRLANMNDHRFIPVASQRKETERPSYLALVGTDYYIGTAFYNRDSGGNNFIQVNIRDRLNTNNLEASLSLLRQEETGAFLTAYNSCQLQDGSVRLVASIDSANPSGMPFHNYTLDLRKAAPIEAYSTMGSLLGK